MSRRPRGSRGSSALPRELEGSRLSLDGLDAEELESFASSSDEGLPDAIRNVARGRGRRPIGIHPAALGDRIVATLELYRTGDGRSRSASACWGASRRHM
jgi:hypothetical protein